MKHGFFLHCLVALLLCRLIGPAHAGTEQYIPIFTGRTIAAPAGRLAPDGLADYLQLLNIRDGGINGVRLVWDECETAFDDARGMACFERAVERDAALLLPLSSGISYALTESSRRARIPMLMLGFGRADASNGRAFPYAFPLIASLFSQAAAQISFIGSYEGGMDRLRGKRIAYLYLDNPTGREAIEVLQALARKHAFSLTLLGVPLPGTEQLHAWRRIKLIRADWVLLAGPGPMTPAALRAAAKVRFPADRIIGFGLGSAEQDVLPAGPAANGFIAVALNPSGANFSVIRDIKRYVVATGQDNLQTEPRQLGSAHYIRGVIQGILIGEAIRLGQRRYGLRPLDGEQLRWGLEQLSLDDERLARLGALELIPPLAISCADHEGSGAVKFQQWLGSRWSVVTDWVQGDASLVRRIVDASAQRYLEANRLEWRDCTDQQRGRLEVDGGALTLSYPSGHSGLP